MLSPSLRVFSLYGKTLLATELMSTCGLVTTLGIIVRCNTTIRPKSVRCVLVACGVKYVRPLVTTLGIVVCYHIAIRPESVCCALMTRGQIFVCCSAITLGLTVNCDIAIKPKFVCYVLVDLSHSLQIRVSLGLQTKVCLSKTCSHWSDPRLLPFRHFFVEVAV